MTFEGKASNNREQSMRVETIRRSKSDKKSEEKKEEIPHSETGM